MSCLITRNCDWCGQSNSWARNLSRVLCPGCSHRADTSKRNCDCSRCLKDALAIAKHESGPRRGRISG